MDRMLLFMKNRKDCINACTFIFTCVSIDYPWITRSLESGTVVALWGGESERKGKDLLSSVFTFLCFRILYQVYVFCI